MYAYDSLFDLKDKVAVVTAGGGVLCSEMSRALAALGAKVAVLDLLADKAEATAKGIRETGGAAVAFTCDALQTESIQAARAAVTKEFGPADILVNGVGGNSPQGTTGGVNITEQIDPTFFDLDPKAIQFVFNLNFLGTLLTTQVFARDMVERRQGAIVNISSMAGLFPLTKIVSYSAAKAAVENYTRWLAVHLAPAGIRVNAIAPGFLLTEQNRFLLVDEKTGAATPRGQTITTNTPMGRYGEPEELIGALVYLAGPAASFVTGTTLIVDGGFSAFSGV